MQISNYRLVLEIPDEDPIKLDFHDVVNAKLVRTALMTAMPEWPCSLQMMIVNDDFSDEQTLNIN